MNVHTADPNALEPPKKRRGRKPTPKRDPNPTLRKLAPYPAPVTYSSAPSLKPSSSSSSSRRSSATLDPRADSARRSPGPASWHPSYYSSISGSTPHNSGIMSNSAPGLTFSMSPYSTPTDHVPYTPVSHDMRYYPVDCSKQPETEPTMYHSHPLPQPVDHPAYMAPLPQPSVGRYPHALSAIPEQHLQQQHLPSIRPRADTSPSPRSGGSPTRLPSLKMILGDVVDSLRGKRN